MPSSAVVVVALRWVLCVDSNFAAYYKLSYTYSRRYMYLQFYNKKFHSASPAYAPLTHHMIEIWNYVYEMKDRGSESVWERERGQPNRMNCVQCAVCARRADNMEESKKCIRVGNCRHDVNNVSSSSDCSLVLCRSHVPSFWIKLAFIERNTELIEMHAAEADKNRFRNECVCVCACVPEAIYTERAP